jgi:ribosomal-protein-alanine N-acetyltransferase
MRLALPEQFSTNRLWCHRLRREDAEEIFYTYASKTEATRFVSWRTHSSLADTRSFLSYCVNAWESGNDYTFGIRLPNRRLIGSCGVVNDEGILQFGYIISPSQWGNGYATEVCQRLMDLLSALPNVKTIGTFVDAENVASARVLIKSGLQELERREKWFRFVNQGNKQKDCILFRLPLRSH